MNDEENEDLEQPSYEDRPARRGLRLATRDYLTLIRLPNVFTAMADVAMGFLVVRPVADQVDAWALAILMAASSLLYIGGVIFNDVFDVDLDRVERPERPLPSGRMSVRIASRFGWKAIMLGVAAGIVAGIFVRHIRTGVVASLLAAAILLYDMKLKRTPFGPLGMGVCRMLNVMLGMNASAAPMQPEHWLVAGSIGIYVTGITWFARSEAGQSDRPRLAMAMAIMMSGIAMLGWLPHFLPNVTPLLQAEPQRWHLLLAIIGTLIAWRCLRAVIRPDSVSVRIAVTHSIFSIVILDAAVCLAVRGAFCATMVVLLLLPALFLGRWIEAT